LLSISYVYDLPFFRTPGMANKILGGWQYSGIMSTQTGTPFSVTYGDFSDNAGVSNGSGPGTYADIVGDPSANVPASAPDTSPLIYNPAAFAAPQGLTFGNSGRNRLRNPRTTNFDMALFKHFKITESAAFEFRAEAFNIFNHTQWNGMGGDLSSPGDFLRPSGAHRARTMQFGAKFIF
ncbi:MAG TPA: carboxypeptidase regulatory-like domain-containing protein, partial [Terriglobales bacterium]